MRKLKRKWLVYWLRVTLSFVSVKHKSYSDEELLQWLKDWADKIGFRPVPNDIKHFPPNYVEVRPADDTQGDEKALLALATEVELTYEEMRIIYEKCDNDYRKTYIVVRMMAITYQTDDSVLAQYTALYEQLKHRLK